MSIPVLAWNGFIGFNVGAVWHCYCTVVPEHPGAIWFCDVPNPPIVFRVLAKPAGAVSA